MNGVRPDRVGELPRRQRKPEVARLQREADDRSAVGDRMEAELHELPAVAHDARAEAAALDRVLSQRKQAEIAALRLAPPEHIVKALGERPTDPWKARTWDRAAQGIEAYRREHGIKDRDTALGRRPEDRTQRRRWEHERENLRRARQRLELEKARVRVVERGMDLGR